MAAPVQIGASWKIGYGFHTYTGYRVEPGLEVSAVGEAQVIKDTNGATQSIIVTDPGVSIKGTWAITSTGSVTPPIVGATVAMYPPDTNSSVNYRCVSSSVKHDVGISMLTLDLIKEGSMTYS